MAIRKYGDSVPTSSRFDCLALLALKDVVASLGVDSSFGRGMPDRVPPSRKVGWPRPPLGVPRAPLAVDMLLPLYQSQLVCIVPREVYHQRQQSRRDGRDDVSTASTRVTTNGSDRRLAPFLSAKHWLHAHFEILLKSRSSDDH